LDVKFSSTPRSAEFSAILMPRAGEEMVVRLGAGARRHVNMWPQMRAPGANSQAGVIYEGKDSGKTGATFRGISAQAKMTSRAVALTRARFDR
jgi:hypothetical protein